MCRLFLMTVALLAVLFGLSGLYMMPKVVQQKIEQKIQLKIGTKTFDRFTRIPIPLTVKFHLFNITNSEAVLAGLERPHFQEVGPFVFKQWRRREIVDIIDNNRKITYREFKTFYASWPRRESPPAPGEFEPSKRKFLEVDEQGEPILLADESGADWEQLEASNDYLNSARLNDSSSTTTTTGRRPIILNPNLHNITIVNLPLLTVLNQLAQLDEDSLKRNVAAKVVARLIKEGKEKILITKPANELLFDGYKVGLMEAASDLISNTLGYNFDSPLPRNKFGFFHNKNNTWSRREAGEMTVFTGRNDSMRDFMQVDNWNGQRELSVWPRTSEAGNRCNEVRGTDGSQFHPGVSRDQVLDIFSPMICTSIFIKYKEDTSTRDIPLLRFTTPAEVFAAPKKNPRNACYCTIKPPTHPFLAHQQVAHQQVAGGGHHHSPPPDAYHARLMGKPHEAHPNQPQRNHKSKITDGRCYIDGLMDLSLCQRGAPIAASGAHFYNSDPMLAMAAGLKPQGHLHETYLDIEPMTGSVFRAASRAQLNALVEQAALEVVEPALIGHMTAMVAPLLWLEEAASIDEKSSREFKGQLLNVVQKGKRSFYYAIAFGFLLALATSLQYWYVTCYKIDTSASKPAGGGRRRRPANSRRRVTVNRKQQLLDEEEEEELRSAARGGRDRQRRHHHRRPRPTADNHLRMANDHQFDDHDDHDDEEEDDEEHFEKEEPRRRRSRSRSGGNSRLARNLAATPLVAGQLARGPPEKAPTAEQLGLGLIGAAALAGAADAAVTANQRRRERRRASRPQDEPQVVVAAAEEDEELSSKRGLVENEWTPAGNQSNQSGSATADEHSGSPVASTSGGGNNNNHLEGSAGDEEEPDKRRYDETDFN